MTTAKALAGLTPARKRGSGSNSTGLDVWPIKSADSRAIFYGDLVQVSLGLVEVVSASESFPKGVFYGCEYEVDGEPKFSKHWIASTSASNIKAYVDTDPHSTYYIQADASVSVGDIGVMNFGVTLGTGSTVTGNSGHGLEAGTRTTMPEMFKVVGYKKEVGNDINIATERAFPIMEVVINRHIDNFVSAAPAILSIG